MAIGVGKSSILRILRTFHDSRTFSPKTSDRGQGYRFVAAVCHGFKPSTAEDTPWVVDSSLDKQNWHLLQAMLLPMPPDQQRPDQGP
ncbi:hypothetical protein TNCV_1564311 [Trichonephila clavipes]|nr:hypothetical protein TNCV_1564311 [Trichonephila clavipes]